MEKEQYIQMINDGLKELYNERYFIIIYLLSEKYKREKDD